MKYHLKIHLWIIKANASKYICSKYLRIYLRNMKFVPVNKLYIAQINFSVLFFQCTYGNLSRRCHSDSPPCRRTVSRMVYKLFPLRSACNRLGNRRSSSRPKDPDNRSHRRKSSGTEPSTEALGHILLADLSSLNSRYLP